MPNAHDIERRAYELYEQRGRAQGHDWDDWFQAERELRTADVPSERPLEAAEASPSTPRLRRKERLAASAAG